MKLKKRTGIIFIIFICFLLLSSFFDYSIAEGMYNRSSLVAKGIDVVAELPTYLLMSFFGAGIYNTRLRDGSKASIASVVIGLGSMIVFGFLCGYVAFWKMNLYSITLVFAIDIGICVCMHILSQLICDRRPDELRKLSKTGLSCFFSMLAVCILLLGVVQRYPFRSLNGTVLVFQDWFRAEILIDFGNIEMRSFPSLTCATAYLCLLVDLMPKIIFRLKETKLVLSIMVGSWLFLVSISQLILGYAYLSDIIIGFIISFSITVLFYYLFYIKENQENTGSV